MKITPFVAAVFSALTTFAGILVFLGTGGAAGHYDLALFVAVAVAFGLALAGFKWAEHDARRDAQR